MNTYKAKFYLLEAEFTIELRAQTQLAAELAAEALAERLNATFEAGKKYKANEIKEALYMPNDFK